MNDSTLKKIDNELQEFIPLSVVIATLGADVLAETIGYLNQGRYVPSEILICIPEDVASLAEYLASDNVRLIKTTCRGQVAQRAQGLATATQAFVMQMDDDIKLLPDAMHLLYQTLSNMGVGHAVAPMYQHLSTGEYITKYPSGINGCLQSISASIICGARWGLDRMGTVTPAGIGFGVDARYCGHDPFETEWLPGGCVLCHQQDLVTDNYYPLPGKALTEDLIHSILWKKKGVRLWVIPRVVCATTVVSMEYNSDSILAREKAHRYVISLMGGSLSRLRFWSCLVWLKWAFISIKGRAR